MENLMNSPSAAVVASVAAASKVAGATQDTGSDTMFALGEAGGDGSGGGGVAVMEAVATQTGTETDTQPETPQSHDIELLDVEAILAGEYTRKQLLEARTYTLLVVRSGKHQGFGAKCGPLIRDTLGYKFDGDLQAALTDMASPNFLTRYEQQVDRWYGLLKTEGVSDATTKANLAKRNDAMALVNDPVAFQKLVKSLLILCQRNQTWYEKGNDINLPYNGHKAILDLFGITVTANRRLSLTAA